MSSSTIKNMRSRRSSSSMMHMRSAYALISEKVTGCGPVSTTNRLLESATNACVTHKSREGNSTSGTVGTGARDSLTGFPFTIPSARSCFNHSSFVEVPPSASLRARAASSQSLNFLGRSPRRDSCRCRAWRGRNQHRHGRTDRCAAQPRWSQESRQSAGHPRPQYLSSQ